MTFKIRPLTLGQEPTIEIDEARFKRLRDASWRDWHYLGIEEKFAVVFANYEEFESDLLTLSLRKALQINYKWSAMLDDRLVLTRRIVNILTAGRLYKDQVGGDLKRLNRRHAVPVVDIDSLWQAEQARSLGFRLMVELRNHVQHSTMPFDQIGYPSRRVGRKDSPLLSFGLDLSIDIAALEADRDFDADITEELDSLDASGNDVVLFVRQYIEGIARVHTSVRATLEEDAGACRAIITEAIEEWKPHGGIRPGLGAVDEADDGQWVDRVSLSLNPSDRRQDLTKRSAMLSDLSRRFVTGERPIENFPTYES